nr:cytochrome c biogenesis protein CcdA [uncultured Desulfuromonas sp.]
MLNEAANIPTFSVAFSAGLLSFFSPCVLPLIPSFITYITGISFGELKQDHPSSKIRWQVASHSLAFVLGFSTVFILLGIIAGSLNQAMQDWLIWLQRGGGLMIFLFGIHMTGLFHFGVLLGDKRITIRNKPSGYLGSFLVGVAFSAGWSPCVGPILMAIFILAAGTSSDTAQAVLLLCCYSAGLGIPFMLSGVLFHGFLNVFNRFKKHIRIMEIITGALMILVGIMLFFNMFSELSSYLYQWLPIE